MESHTCQEKHYHRVDILNGNKQSVWKTEKSLITECKKSLYTFCSW